MSTMKNRKIISTHPLYSSIRSVRYIVLLRTLNLRLTSFNLITNRCLISGSLLNSLPLTFKTKDEFGELFQLNPDAVCTLVTMLKEKI